MPTRCILALLNEAQSSRLWLYLLLALFLSPKLKSSFNFDSYMMLNKSVILLKVIFTVQVCKFDNEYMDHIKVLFKIKKTLSTYLVISSTNIFRVFTFFHFLQLN